MHKKSRTERRRDKLKTKDTISLTEKIKPFLSFKHPVTGFCLVFATLLIVFSFFMFQKSVEEKFIHPLTALIASHAAWILNVLNMKVVARGITITGKNFSVEILGNPVNMPAGPYDLYVTYYLVR